MPPRIVIVDDDPPFLATVRLLLEAEGFDVVGEALTGLDGVGGADPAAGSGLRGLADRVEALCGALEVVSPAGAGTSLRAEIPGELGG